MLLSIPIQNMYSPKPGQAETTSEKHSLGEHVFTHSEFFIRVLFIKKRKRKRLVHKRVTVKQQQRRSRSREKSFGLVEVQYEKSRENCQRSKYTTTMGYMYSTQQPQHIRGLSGRVKRMDSRLAKTENLEYNV